MCIYSIQLLIYNEHVYCITGKFGGELKLAVWWIDQPTTKLKPAKISSVRIYIRMTIPYRTAKLKSTNISESYSCQIFRLYIYTVSYFVLRKYIIVSKIIYMYYIIEFRVVQDLRVVISDSLLLHTHAHTLSVLSKRSLL